MCGIENKGIPANQNIIANFFFENNFLILKFFNNDHDPFIGFLPDKNMSINDFLINNPSLSAIAINEKHDYLLIYLENITKRNIINYLSSVLQFIIHLCISRNEEVSTRIISTLGLSFKHIFLCVSNIKIHAKLRKHYMTLLFILYFDKETRTPLSQSQQRCFLWDPTENSIEEEINSEKKPASIFEKVDQKPIPLTEVID